VPISLYLKLEGSLQAQQIKRWDSYFKTENRIIIRSEDLFQAPKKTLSEIQSFLTISDHQGYPEKAWNRGNYSESPEPKIRRKLKDYFHPHVKALNNYLNQEFYWPEFE
jgi:hypothetical protein